NSFDIDRLNLETIMFQSGYLTIKEEIKRRNRIEYILTYPNYETKISFNDYLIDYFVTNYQKKNSVKNGLIDLLEIADLDNLEQVIKSLFASIAYNNFTNNYIENYEGFYASVFYAYFAGAGFDKIVAEDATSEGRIDLSVFIDDKVYIFEFKVDTKGALEQIKEKGYHKKYLSSYNEIYLLGIEFDSQKRNVTTYKWERIY
ncbi:MAG: PD-(D/E)XK nuclease domain-containing protein, partial [Sulfurovaceae bacterium]|nr:PD-(D/E)XK nuclease domain-containing protein [Sulfurovaceae bacterium]